MIETLISRVFEPGTTGWTIQDLDDPEILWLWSEGRFEIVEGVLTTMAPQGFETVDPLEELRRHLERHLDKIRVEGKFYREVDLLLKEDRVPRPDLIFLTAEQRREQKRISRQHGLPLKKYHPVYVTPLLIIESLSIGHERHDRVTKQRWYEKARVPRYWLLTEHERTLVCLALENDRYIEEAVGKGNDSVVTSAFGGLTIKLSEIWGD